MHGVSSVRRFFVKYPLAVLFFIIAAVVAYLVFIRETFLATHPKYGAILTAALAGLGFILDRIFEVYWEEFHKKLSSSVLRMWRWLSDDHFRLSFFVTTIHESPPPESGVVADMLGKLDKAFKIVLIGDNYIVLRSDDAPLTFHITWQPETLNEEALEHGLDDEPRYGTELTVSLSQDLVLGYRTGRRILDAVINKYFQIAEGLERVFGPRSSPNVFAEGTWSENGSLGSVTRTFRDRTFGADVDIVGAGLHVRATSTDALKSLYSHIGSLPVC